MAKKQTNLAKLGSDSNKKSKSSRKTWLNIFDKNVTWDDKDEVLDAVYWFRQILAIFMGLIWGYLGLTGILGIVSFCILNSVAAYAIANKTGYEFDPDEGFLCIKEGFMTTFATFIVSWIVIYTSIHFDES